MEVHCGGADDDEQNALGPGCRCMERTSWQFLARVALSISNTLLMVHRGDAMFVVTVRLDEILGSTMMLNF